MPGPRRPADLDDGCFEPPCPVPECGRFTRWVPVGEDTPPDPRNIYAATKLHQEHLCSLWAAIWIDGRCLRYHNVYGPRMLETRLRRGGFHLSCA